MKKSEQSQFDGYRARLEIDGLRIDDELCRHPMLVQDAAEGAARFMQIRDEAKIELDRAKARAARRLRDECDNDGKRLPQAQIEHEIVLDEDVQDAQGALSDAQLDYDLWKGLVDAARTKSTNMKTFGELTVAGYLAPSTIYDKRKEAINQVRQRKRLERQERDG